MIKSMSSEFIRFILAGGANTVATYALYLLLLAVFPYPTAYTVSYAVGIALAYYLNSLFVFRQPLQWKKTFTFPLVYVIQYCVGIALLFLLVEVFHVSAAIAPLLVIACTVPLTFVLSRRVLVKG